MSMVTRSKKGMAAIWSIKRPFPSQLRTLWGDPDRFKKTYFPEELGGKDLSRRRFGAPRQRRLFLDHGPQSTTC